MNAFRRWFTRPQPAEVLSTAIGEAKQFENDLQREHARLAEEKRVNRVLTDMVKENRERELVTMEGARRFLSEMVEAQAMCGSGPWQGGSVDAFCAQNAPLREALNLREGGPVGDISPLGAYGMYELLLQNVNWQREINYSWLEFTRWGIQQIILICRLYYVKNPIPRRLVDVIAQYVFARGFDVTTDDPAANDQIKAFIRRNAKVLGHVALTAQQRSKITDGNLFWAFFTGAGTGETDLRTIDATEVQEIITDPEDADTPWYYQRIWTQRTYDPAQGAAATRTEKRWYPAIGVEDLKPGANAVAFHPASKPKEIKGIEVNWDISVYHRKIGTVGKWIFGCPPMYPMVDWVKESRRFLEACASVRQSLSQFATKISTKGGQQAIEGIKQQMETQVGPGSPIYDSNPPTVSGGTWISGPGTTLDAFKVQGATFSPEDVRRYLLMCCMTLGMPETFLGDVSTGNLATATSLDRPTETVFLSIQEEWIEDLTVIVAYMLSKWSTAPAGKLREGATAPKIRYVAAERMIRETRTGARFWGFREAKKDQKSTDEIEVRVQFPAIREGDMVANVKAMVEAMTLDNKGGQIVGIDEKAGVLLLMQELGIENAEELADLMYPPTGKDKYDPDRTNQVLPPPIQKVQDQPGVQPQPGQVTATKATMQQQQDKPVKEAVRAAFDRLTEAVGAHLNGE